jgi:hypothetical protein
MDEITETFETPEEAAADMPGQLTVQDVLDAAEATPYHTILEIWRGVLAPAREQIGSRITPQWATRMVSTYAQVKYEDMPAFGQLYYERIGLLADILDLEIEIDDECLNRTSAQEDVENNSEHYVNLLTEWQRQFLQWEIDWDATSPTAAIEVAALSEVHKMFFDPQGITALLDEINFVFTDGDRENLAEALQELLTAAEAV